MLSFLLKPDKHCAAWEKSKFKSVFLLDLLLHYWFFIDMEMPTEWKFAFLKAAIIIFYLIYSLNVPHSNQNPPFFPFERVSINLHCVKSVHIWSFSGLYLGKIRTRKTPNTDTFHAVLLSTFPRTILHCVVKIILTFLFLWLWF